MKGRQASLENLELKCWQLPEGLVEQERSYQTGCEQVAGSMHSKPKKAGGLKKTDASILHRVTPTICVLLHIP